MLDVLVIGAGQAGLAAAYTLTKQGLNFQILEASEIAAGSWPHYYQSLKLFSPARFSSLPGMPFPGAPDRYPVRDEVIDYLQDYARHLNFPIVYQAKVSHIRRDGSGFNVFTENGAVYQARTVIAASGPFNQPNIPAFPGLSQFAGTVLHSAKYFQPSDVPGQRVAIIGAGNSAVQIAYELAKTHQVTLTARQAPKFLAQRPLGLDLHVWLTRSGLDRLPLGDWLQWQPTTPVLDHGEYRQAFASGALTLRPIFERITANGLQWGEQIEPFDALILATGFIHSPAYLERLDGLTAQDAAEQKGGVALHVPGLYFVGASWQRSNASATIRGVGADAAHVVAHLQRYLQQSFAKDTARRFKLAHCCK